MYVCSVCGNPLYIKKIRTNQAVYICINQACVRCHPDYKDKEERAGTDNREILIEILKAMKDTVRLLEAIEEQEELQSNSLIDIETRLEEIRDQAQERSRY